MKACVIVFPGSNCDRDMQVALRSIMGIEPKMVWYGDSDFDEFDLITLPGGFSYGDYLRCGAMASKAPVMKEVINRAKKGVPVLGVCNGFQILIEGGLLPGALIRNCSLNYVCKDVYLTVDSDNSIFTKNYKKGQVIRIPIAHSDGNYFAEEHILDSLEDNNCIAFRYSDRDGNHITAANPNGSLRNIAGILNENHNVLGMMPHPERLSDPILGGDDGKKLFQSLITSLS